MHQQQILKYWQRFIYLIQYSNLSYYISFMDQAFRGLLERVGGQGRYQNTLIVLTIVIALQCTFTAVMNNFLFYQNDFQCPDNIAECQEYVCSLPPEQQTQFIDPSYNSLLGRLGNFRCERKTEAVVAQLIIYTAGMISPFVAALLLRWLTQRQMLVVIFPISIVGLTITIFSSTLVVATLGLFINFFGRSVQIGLALSFLSEKTSTSIKAKCNQGYLLGIGIGFSMVGPVFYLIQPWELAILIYSIIPLLILFLVFHYVIVDTPFDAVTKKEPSKALRQLLSIASINNIQCDLKEEDIVQVKERYQISQLEHSHGTKVSMIDLCRFRSLRWITLICLLIRFCTAFSSNVPSLYLKDLSSDMYLNSLVLGSGQVVAAIIGFFIITSTPRKSSMLLCWLTCTVLYLLLFMFVPCMKKDNCQTFQNVLQSAGLFICRFTVSLCNTFYNTLLTEIFPSQIKSIAIQLVYFGNSMVFIVAPGLQAFFQAKKISVIALFGIVTLIGFLLTLGLKETFGETTPELIQELRQENRDLQDSAEKAEQMAK